MTQEQKTKIGEHYDWLYSIAIGLTPNIPDDIRDTMRAAYLAGADYALDIYSPRWISVEEELPPYGEQVLVYAQEDPECGLWWSRRYTEDKAKFMSIDGETEYQVLTDKNGFASMRDENDEPLQVSHWQKIKPPVLSNSGNTGKDLKGGEE